MCEDSSGGTTSLVHPSLFGFFIYFYFLGDRRSSSWHSANDNPGHSPARRASLGKAVPMSLSPGHTRTGTAQPTCMVPAWNACRLLYDAAVHTLDANSGARSA
jgi:hypothetical protein